MSRSNLQRNLPPMEVGHSDNTARSVQRTDSARVESLDSIDLVTVARLAAKRVSTSDQQLAAIFQLNDSLFYKSFDPNNDTHNRTMKARLPKAYAEAFVREMAQLLGLRIGGSEQQTRAFKNVLRACQEFVEASEL